MNLTNYVCLLLLAASVSSCKQERPQPVPVEPLPAAKKVDDQTAREIVKTADQLLKQAPEKLSDADKKAAVDASKLHGQWEVRNIIMRTNGKSGGPTKPLVPTRWAFTKDGRFTMTGGMKIDGSYAYTGDTLMIAGLGPKQTYRVDALTDTELRVTAKIDAGSVHIENTTILRRL